MPDKNEEIEESTEIQDPVDFDNPESRMNFLKTQLNDLVDGINNVYGQDLMDELIKRLEKTVEDFNVEVSGLIGKLKDGKIFNDASADKEDLSGLDSDSLDESNADEDEPEKSFDNQEQEDSDIIKRMRARMTTD